MPTTNPTLHIFQAAKHIKNMHFPLESLNIIKGIAYPDEKLKAAPQRKVNESKEYRQQYYM